MISGGISNHAISALPATPPPALTAAAAYGQIIYLMELTTQAGGGAAGVVTGGVSAFAISGGAIAGSSGVAVSSGQFVIRLSDAGFITAPSDTPSNTYYEPRLTVPLVVDRAVMLSPEGGMDGSHRADAEFINQDGYFDSSVSESAIEGQPVIVLAGNPANNYSSFSRVWTGVAAGWENNGDNVRVEIRDTGYLMDVPLQPSLYAGTGTYEGPADFAGKPKPLMYGKCVNVTPILIDQANLIYQFHSGSSQALNNVYDNGAAVTFQADTTNLYSGSTTAGQYRSDISRGLFQLGALPAGVITCTAQGNNTGGYVDAIPDIASRILSQQAGLGAVHVDAATFTLLKASFPYAGNVYFPGETTVRAAFTMLLNGIGAQWFSTRYGRIAVSMLKVPDPGSRVLDLDTLNVIELKRRNLPSSIFPPHRKRVVGYNKNWTVQRGEDLAGSVSAATRQFLASEWRTTQAENGSIVSKHPQSQTPVMLETNLDTSTGAQAVADNLIALHGAERQLFEARIKSIGLTVNFGDTVKLTWPRFNLSGSKFLRAWPVREDFAARETTLLMWG